MKTFRVRAFLRQRVMQHSMQQIFARMYLRNSWGSGESVSGEGSELMQTAIVRREIEGLINELHIKTLLDAPCGDYNWMRWVRAELEQYTGVDIVPELVQANLRRYAAPRTQFAVLNICEEQVPKADLIVCRDFLVHLPLRAAVAAVANFVASGSKYLLATTYPGLVRKNKELIIIGNWRPLDLQLPPFSLPPPTRMVNEECTAKDDFDTKSLGLWDLDDVRSPSQRGFTRWCGPRFTASESRLRELTQNSP